MLAKAFDLIFEGNILQVMDCIFVNKISKNSILNMIARLHGGAMERELHPPQNLPSKTSSIKKYGLPHPQASFLEAYIVDDPTIEGFHVAYSS